MSKLWNERFGEQRRDLAFQALYQPRPAEFVVPSNDGLYHRAAEIMGEHEPITYLEFGVADGHSIRKVAREFHHPESMFIGFDSFVGLPEGWMMHNRGAFTNRGEIPDIGDSRVKLVKGWFQNTLHESLSWLLPRLSGRVLIHYDADLYSSTLFLLTSLWPHCPEYHFIMDDFMVDDIVALYDFSLSYPVQIEFLGRREGGIPHSVLGRIARVEFTLADDEKPPSSAVAGPRDEQSTGDRIEDVLRYSRAAADRHDWPEALRRWESARGKFPNHPAPLYGSAVALRELGRFDEAEAILSQGQQRFPGDAGLALEYAWVAHTRRDWAKALRRWEQARAVAPDLPGGYVWGAQTLCALGRGAEAEALLRKACDLLPREVALAVELARFFQDKGDWTEAERRWRDVVIRFPDSPEGRAGLAAAQGRQAR